MKFLFAAIVACVYLVTVQAEGEDLPNPENHRSDIRPRLGHFRDDKIFLDLYKTYAAAFVLPEHKERDNDDYRNYLPSGDECMVFFRKFRIDDYVLRDIDEFIVLDACLGYLYESTYQEEDSAHSATLRENLDDYKNDQKLKDLWEQTQVDTLSEGSKKCVGRLMKNAVQVKKQYPNFECNNHWLDLFNRFASCQSEMLPLRESDSYMKVIYDLVKARANECFEFEIKALMDATYKEYKNNPFSVAGNYGKSYWSDISKQKINRDYPDRLADVLQAIQGTKGEINIREVADIVRGVATDDAVFKKRIVNNLAKYANWKIDPTGWHLHKTSRGVDDKTGIKRYDALVGKTCNFFRATDSEGFYDFVTPFTRMVTMLKYPEVFDISKETFINKILKHNATKTGALYLAVSGCNIMSYTEGQFVKDPEAKGLEYKVVFKRNLSGMVQWPDVGYY